MKPTFPILFTAAASLLAAAPATAAFNPEVVAADARWLVHVDLVALRESTLGQALLSGVQAMTPEMQQGAVQPDFAKIFATVGTITAYGSNLSKDPAQLDGTLVLQGREELRQIIEAWVLQASITEPETVVEAEGLPFEAYTLKDVIVGFPEEPIVVVSKSAAQLRKAYDVFRGKAPSLASQARSSQLMGLLPKSGRHFLIAASVVPDTSDLLPENSSQSRILRMATAGMLALGEDNNTTAANLQLKASDDRSAEKLSRILQGMAALVSLAESSDQDLNRFLQSITSQREGPLVSLTLSYPSDRLIELVQTFQQDAFAHREHGGDNDGGDRGGNRPAEPAMADGIGAVVTTWWADADLPGNMPAPETLTQRLVDRVTLGTGATITISGRRGGGEHARVDYLEIAPLDGGGAPVRIEAEYMRLENYRIERADFASGGEIARLNDGDNQGFLRYRYLGATGDYRVTIGYVDENDGQSSFALGVAEAGPEATP